MSETPIKAFTPDVKQGRIAMLHFLPKENQVTSTRNLLWKYVSALKENIELRFHNTLPLLGALSIFDPNLIPTSATELSSYGVESIRVLASHYCPEQHVRLLAEWNILKYHMKEKTIPADVKEEKTIMPAEWCMGQMMIQRSTFTSLLPSAMHGLRGLLVECSWSKQGSEVEWQIRYKGVF